MVIQNKRRKRTANQILNDQHAHIKEENTGKSQRRCSHGEKPPPPRRRNNTNSTDLLVVLEAVNNHTCTVEGNRQVFTRKYSQLKLVVWPSRETRDQSPEVDPPKTIAETSSPCPYNTADPIGTENSDSVPKEPEERELLVGPDNPAATRSSGRPSCLRTALTHLQNYLCTSVRSHSDVLPEIELEQVNPMPSKEKYLSSNKVDLTGYLLVASEPIYTYQEKSWLPVIKLVQSRLIIINQKTNGSFQPIRSSQ